MTCRILNNAETNRLYLFMIIRNKHDLAGEIATRMTYNLASWIPYGGPPDENTTMLYLDSRWSGDEELVKFSLHYGIGSDG